MATFAGATDALVSGLSAIDLRQFIKPLLTSIVCTSALTIGCVVQHHIEGADMGPTTVGQQLILASSCSMVGTAVGLLMWDRQPAMPGRVILTAAVSACVWLQMLQQTRSAYNYVPMWLTIGCTGAFAYMCARLTTHR